MNDKAKAPDFRVLTTVYNDHIMRQLAKLRMVHAGAPSIRQLIQKMGYGFGSSQSGKELEIRNIIGLKVVPCDEVGDWKPIALEIAETLKSEPDDLWPGDLKNRVPAEINRTLYAEVGQDARWLVMAKS